jgi:hypothetical protein
VTQSQIEAADELRRSAWDVGFSYGLQGTPLANMLLAVRGEAGGRVDGDVVQTLIAGFDAGRESKLAEGEAGPRVRIASDEIPF